MTLIVYARCQNGCILISDKQASFQSGGSTVDRKTFLSRNRDFACGGAGTGFDLISIFSDLINDGSVVGSNVAQRLREMLPEYCDNLRYSMRLPQVEGLILAYENDRLMLHEVSLVGLTSYVRESPAIDTYKCCGEKDAILMANYLLKKRKLDEWQWDTAVQYTIAIMREVGLEVDGVGRIDEVGIDVIVMLDSGYVYELENYREASPTLNVEFETLYDFSSRFQTRRENFEDSQNE